MPRKAVDPEAVDDEEEDEDETEDDEDDDDDDEDDEGPDGVADPLVPPPPQAVSAAATASETALMPATWRVPANCRTIFGQFARILFRISSFLQLNFLSGVARLGG